MELRAYRAVKTVVDDPDTEAKDVPDSPLVDDVLAARGRQLEERT